MGQEELAGGINWGKKNYIPAKEIISQRPGRKQESTIHSTFFSVACLYQNYLSMCLENKKVHDSFKISLILMMRGQEMRKRDHEYKQGLNLKGTCMRGLISY